MKLRAVLTIILMVLWTLPLLPVQIAAVAFGWRDLAERIPVLYHSGLARLLRLRVRTVGTMSPDRPTLFVINHVSWLDIVVLDTLIRASYVTKMEVGEWPIFGTLARLQRCVFIERKAARSRDQKDQMLVRLEAGDNLILFPEGTSADGMRILPFKSTFFALAEKRVNGQPLVVQPVSLAYAELNGLPVGRRWMSRFAWVGDQALVPHLWQFLCSGPSTAEVTFHPPVTIEQFASRKDMAAWCQHVVARGVSATLSGRRPPPLEPPARPAPAPLPAPAA